MTKILTKCKVAEQLFALELLFGSFSAVGAVCLSFEIVLNLPEAWLMMAGLLFLPVLSPFAPLYVALFHGSWMLALIIYFPIFVSWALHNIRKKLIRKRIQGGYMD